jgi:GNAT superfamily N-acetyltransferase
MIFVYAETSCQTTLLSSPPAGGSAMQIAVETDLRPEELDPFFVDWLARPAVATRRQLLAGSQLVITARDGERLAGFLTAITDGAMHALITLVEVLPSYQGQGLGSRMLHAALDSLGPLYQVVLVTDLQTVPFYEKQGFRQSPGMVLQDFAYQEKRGRATGREGEDRDAN